MHSEVAAANPEIKASVTGLISGYICDRATGRWRAEQTNKHEEYAANTHSAENCHWLVKRKQYKR